MAGRPFEKTPIDAEGRAFLKSVKGFTAKVTPHQNLKGMVEYNTIPIITIGAYMTEAKSVLDSLVETLAANPSVGRLSVELNGTEHNWESESYKLLIERISAQSAREGRGTYRGRFITPAYDKDTRPIELFSFELQR